MGFVPTSPLWSLMCVLCVFNHTFVMECWMSHGSHLEQATIKNNSKNQQTTRKIHKTRKKYRKCVNSKNQEAMKQSLWFRFVLFLSFAIRIATNETRSTLPHVSTLATVTNLQWDGLVLLHQDFILPSTIPPCACTTSSATRVEELCYSWEYWKYMICLRVLPNKIS